MSELTAMDRAFALTSLDLSSPAKSNTEIGATRKYFMSPLPDFFGNWERVSQPYYKQGKTQRYTVIDVRCKCGEVCTRLLNSLRRGESTRCADCGRRKL